MSKVKVGDRVRVVIEAEASSANGGWIGIQGCGHFRESEFGVVSIEVIPAPFVLPTKRWAQVLDDDREQFWTRTKLTEEDEYPWVTGWGDTVKSDLDLMRMSGLRVISEGVDDE